MEIYSRLYIGDSVNNPDKAIKKLKKGSRLLNIFVITVAYNPNDQLDIYSSQILCQKYYRRNKPYVIGIAGTYEEALELVVQITNETVTVTGGGNIKEYLF